MTMVPSPASPHRRPAPARLAAARGFTLVEVLVSIAIGVVILLAVSVMYARNSSNFSEIEKTGDLLENARYALDVITEDLQTAGYYGEFDPNTASPAWQNGDPCGTSTGNMGWDTSSSPVKMPYPVFGLAGSTSASCLSNRQTNTQALSVRHATPDASNTKAAMVASNTYLQVSRCVNDTKQIIASDTAGDFTLKNIGCTGVIDELRRFLSRTYYVASCGDCTGSGDGIPSLKRAEPVNGQIRVTPIAEGIERFAIEYGIDSNADGKPDEFIDVALVTGTAPRKWSNVVSVRVTLLARARTTTQNYTDPRTYTIAGATYAPADGFKRTLLTSTVRLTTVAGRLEK